MKAIVNTKYGSPDVLRLTEVAKPVPGDNQILIKVHAASVNPLDWHILRASPFFIRAMFGLLRPKTTVLGGDVAGRVEAVGKNVTLFQPGDEVYGDIASHGLGAFAEYVCVSDHAPLVLKPAGLTFEQAAAVPVAAITALQSLQAAGVKAGQKILINGASGGVGTFTVQLAKASGAEVTAVCSTKKLDMVRSIGADHAIDYKREDYSRSGQQYDVIIDNVGNGSVAGYKRALTPHGVCVIIGFTTLGRMIGHAVWGAWASKTGTRKIGMMGSAQPSKPDLAELSALLESGKVTPLIDRCYPLSEVPEAIRYLEQGHARGKVVITVDKGGQ